MKTAVWASLLGALFYAVSGLMAAFIFLHLQPVHPHIPVAVIYLMAALSFGGSGAVLGLLLAIVPKHPQRPRILKILAISSLLTPFFLAFSL